MLARSGSFPLGSGYGFEVKWDGFRALVDSRNGITIRSRRGWDMTDMVPEIQGFPARGIFDGELIAFDNEGRPSFPVLCDRVLHRRSTAPLMYAIFDVLELEGRATAPLPYRERRGILEALDLGGGGWFTPDVYDDGPALFAAVVEAGLEGIVAKRLTDPYKPGERGWVKIKNRAYWRFAQERDARARQREKLTI